AAPKAVLVVVNRDGNAFSREGLCRNWIAQSGLNEGFSVVAINRPAYGRSTGPFDYGGSRDVAAITAAVKASQELSKVEPQNHVFWGYGTAVIGLTQVVRQGWRSSALIIGGGVYDTDSLSAAESP